MSLFKQFTILIQAVLSFVGFSHPIDNPPVIFNYPTIPLEEATTSDKVLVKTTKGKEIVSYEIKEKSEVVLPAVATNTPSYEIMPEFVTVATTTPTEIATTTEIVADPQHELEKLLDKNQVDSLYVAPPASTEIICDKKIWDGISGTGTASPEEKKEIVVFNQTQSWYFDDFSVIKENDKFKIDILPSGYQNLKNHPIEFKVLSWISDIKNISANLQKTTSDKLPMYVDYSDDYAGHSLSFQLFVSYPCFNKNFATFIGIKAERNSIVTLDL